MPLPSLILVPGLACTADLWQDQVAALADVADVHVTSAHLRHETIGAMATAILASAPDRFTLAGLSMGGYIVLEIMRQAAERVTGLILLDTSARADTPEQTARRQVLIELATTSGMTAVIRQLLPLMLHPDGRRNDDLVRRVIAMAEACGVEEFIRQQHAIIGRPDARNGLGEILCPTVVACGDADRITLPEWSKEMAALIPDARLTMIPACGHMSSMEQPSLVTDILRAFLV